MKTTDFDLHLYEYIDSGFDKKYTIGNNFPFKERPVNFRNLTLPITVSKGKPKLFLINVIKDEGPLSFPIYIHTEKGFSEIIVKDSIKHTIYFSILFLIAFLSIAVSIFLIRNTIFAYYALYVFTISLSIFTTLGYTYQLIIPNEPELIRHVSAFASTLATIFFVLYVNNLFDAKKQFPILYKICRGVIVFFIIGAVVWIVFPQVMMEMAFWLLPVRYAITVCVFIIFQYYAVKTWKSDKVKSIIFLLAHSFMIIGAVITILFDVGTKNWDILIFQPLMIGVFTDILALSVIMFIMIKRHLTHRRQLLQKNEHLSTKVEGLENYISTMDKEQTVITLKSKSVINLNDIYYILSDGHYLEFHLKHKRHPEIDRNTIKNLLDALPTNQFVQIHRSYIINLQEIKTIYANKVILNNHVELPVSRTFKPHLQKIAKIS